ncbi:unnamed protein product [Sphagnum compactum]
MRCFEGAPPFKEQAAYDATQLAAEEDCWLDMRSKTYPPGMWELIQRRYMEPLAELAKNNRNRNIICDEGEESPLLCLFRDGSSKGQEEAANALGFSVAERMHIFGVQQEHAITMFLQIVGP